ncbi:MAG: hypothetical protein PHG85_00695 [Candidatus Altiarchaeota archaeon]|nr:hypothetical protein [Candidatus Altiarchaeota archaeon]
MKTEFVKKIAEAGRTMLAIQFFGILLDALVLFLAVGVLMTILGINIAYALIPAAAYLVFESAAALMKSNILGTIEKKHKKLDERLSTAHDNQDNPGNIIVESLIKDVTGELDVMESSEFFESRKVSSRVMTSMALIFLILIITVIDFRGMAGGALDLNSLMRGVGDALRERGIEYERLTGGEDRWENSNLTTEKEDEKMGADPGGDRPGALAGPIPGTAGGVGSDESTDIFGKPSNAAIEGENVDLDLHPDYGGEIEIKDDDGSREQMAVEAGAERAQTSESCDECAVGPGNEELVKRYFEKILGEA